MMTVMCGINGGGVIPPVCGPGQSQSVVGGYHAVALSGRVTYRGEPPHFAEYLPCRQASSILNTFPDRQANSKLKTQNSKLKTQNSIYNISFKSSKNPLMSFWAVASSMVYLAISACVIPSTVWISASCCQI